MPHKPGLGAIFGIVAEDGVAKNASPVYLLDRTGPRIIRTVLTADDGGFVFSGLDPDESDYMVMATDEDGDEGDPYKNALIRDRVSPTPIHLGTYYPSAWWSIAAKHMPAVIGPAPYYDDRFNHVNLLGASNAPGIIEPQGGVWSVTDESPFAGGALNLPVITLTELTWAQLYAQSAKPTANAAREIWSVVVVADFAQAWGVTQQVVATTQSSDSGYATRIPRLRLGFDGTNTIRVELRNHYYLYHFSGDLWDDTYSQQKHLHTHEMGTPPTGWAMVAVSLRGGDIINLYIGEQGSPGETTILNNTSVDSRFNTVAASITDTIYWAQLGPAGLHGYYEVGAATGPRFAFYMAAPKFLYEEDLNELKDALWDGGFPTESGYARAVTIDLPAYYYRMDELNNNNTALVEHYEGDVDLEDPMDVAAFSDVSRRLRFSAGGVTTFTNETGPTAGRSAMVFDGSWCLYTDMAGLLPSYRNMTISFWFKMSQTPPGDNYLIRTNMNKWNTSIKNFYVRVQADRKMLLFLSENAAEYFYTAQQFEVDVWYHIAWVINKSNSQVLLYVDGTLSEEFGATTDNINYYYGAGLGDGNRASLNIGGTYDEDSASGAATTAECFRGSLAEIALFSYPLKPERIADHYANKDVI